MINVLRLALLLVIAPSVAPAWTPEIDSTGWERIEAGDGAQCALGDRYSFFYHPDGDATQLLIYFEGGGACWDWVSCSGMFDTGVERDEISQYRGIFDFSNPANPFQEYAVLFIPYCTGDVHIGNVDRAYGENKAARPVTHRGARNVDQALQWVKARLDDPKRVVVAGASAGSYGAIFHAPRIAELYPSADLVTIGDSGVPLLKGYEEILESWGAGSILRPLWHIDDGTPMTLERANRQAAASSNMRAVVQITSDQDAIQSAFYLISGSPYWREDTYALLDSLEQEIPSFHSFVVAGADHGLLRTDAFYDYEADGKSLADWIGRLASGKDVSSVRCAQCSIQ